MQENEILEKFYLDYVGCKVYEKRLFSIRKFVFYLDYVGCKVKVSTMDIDNGESFISTMWDVKWLKETWQGIKDKVLSRLCGM